MVTSIKKQTLITAARPADSKAMAVEWFAAFTGISDAHGFSRDMQSVEQAHGRMDTMLKAPHSHPFVAVEDGEVVGGAILWEGETVAGIGPVFVRPRTQDAGIGRKLMEAAIERADSLGQESVRLCQAAYNGASLALYVKLGFSVMEPLAFMTHAPQGLMVHGISVRKAVMGDLFDMDRLCHNIHMHSRHGEIRAAIEQGTARVAFRRGELLAYSTDLGYLGHTAAYSNEAIIALLASAGEFNLGGIIVPTRNSELLQWCLNNGMRIKFPATLMCRGWYEQPHGPFLPSALY